MLVQELKLSKDVEIKFYRLTPPLFNTSNLPLSGLYQAQSEINDFNFQKKILKVGVGGWDNFFTFGTVFGKVFLNEKLEGLIIFSNISDNFITIKDLEINIIIEPIKDPKNKIQKKIRFFWNLLGNIL